MPPTFPDSLWTPGSPIGVRVIRDLYTGHSTQGQLYIDGSPYFYTLEPPVKKDGSKPRAIPAGTYPLTVRWSAEFQKHVPHVESVPGFVAIEQHVGNFPRDTKGCTLVGMMRGPAPDFIAQSLVAFSHLMSIYLARAVLTNPADPEPSHIWQVGTVTYEDA